MRVCQHCKVVLFSNSTRHICALEIDDSSFTCPRCGNVFARKRGLMRHVKHYGHACGRMYGAGPKPYACHQCDRRFVRARDIPRHIREACPGMIDAVTGTGIVVDDTLNVPLKTHKPKRRKQKSARKGDDGL